MAARLREIRVIAAPASPARGVLVAGGLRVRCALGRSGIRRDKHEGDGATPSGRHRLVAVLYRPDRLDAPRTPLPVLPIARNSGWCDDPHDRRYNRLVRLPCAAGHEDLWRSDRLYDLVVVLDYNLATPKLGKGSAIFLHVAAPGLTPTAGCVAIELPILRRLLALSGPDTDLVVA